MSNFDAIPDPWEEKPTAKPAPTEPPQKTAAVTPDDLGETASGNPEEDLPPPPDRGEQVPSLPIEARRRDPLMSRISKYRPLEVEEADETLSLLDMPLTDLQAAFGIGTARRQEQTAAPTPTTDDSPAETVVPPAEALDLAAQSTLATEEPSLVDALDIRASLTPEQLTSQIPFPEDDIFVNLGQISPPLSAIPTTELESNLESPSRAIAPVPSPESESPHTTTSSPTESEESEPDIAAQLLELLEPTPKPAPKSAPTPTPEPVSPPTPPGPHPDLATQVTRELLDLMVPPAATEPTPELPPDSAAEPVTGDSPEPEPSRIVAAAPEPAQPPLSPLQRRQAALEARLAQELADFWGEVNHTPTPSLPATLPAAPLARAAEPDAAEEEETAAPPATVAAQAEEASATAKTSASRERDLINLFRLSSAAQQDDPLGDIRSFLLKQAAPSNSSKRPREQPVTLPQWEDLVPDAPEFTRPELPATPRRPRRTTPLFTPTTPLEDKVDYLEAQLRNLEQQLYKPTEVINPLLPLIAQLLKTKLGPSQEAVREAATPILDTMIQERARQDRAAMAEALAGVIPDAISQEIKEHPERVAKAIGPEVGAAIREQIRIERNAISESLGPTISRAIKHQIELERDSMVDALYPVIGSTVARYMGEVLSTINDKVENTLSIDGISRKIRARFQGVTEAELILQESMPAQVQAIFLIHKISGLVIAEIQPELEQRLEANLLAGMLTAIRSFVNDCIAQTGTVSELSEIEYGDSRILLEVAGYCYLAVVAKGSLPQPFINRMRRLLSHLIQRHGDAIEHFEGDSETVPPEIAATLHQLGAEQNAKADYTPRRSPTTLLVLAGVLVALIALPWLYFQVRGWFDQRLARQIATALTELDPVAYTPLEPEVRGQEVILHGRVPTARVKAEAAAIAQTVAPDKAINNTIQVVETPPDPTAVATAVNVVTDMLNRTPGIEMQTTYSPEQVTVSGVYTDPEARKTIEQTLEALPGIPPVNYGQLIPQALQERIYFATESAQIDSGEQTRKLLAIVEFLQANPETTLQIIGHADHRGEAENNQQLARDRAIAVQDFFVAQGIAEHQLAVEGEIDHPPGIRAQDPLWLSRCVRFEIADMP